jgi:hypothetical protein
VVSGNKYCFDELYGPAFESVTLTVLHLELFRFPKSISGHRFVDLNRTVTYIDDQNRQIN